MALFNELYDPSPAAGSLWTAAGPEDRWGRFGVLEVASITPGTESLTCDSMASLALLQLLA